jgi:hypothetical protein
MRFTSIAPFGLLVMAASLFAQEPPASPSPEAQRIERLEAQVRQLTKRIDELQAKLAEVQEQKEENKPSDFGIFPHNGANAAALKKLTLSKNPTHEQAAEYVSQILRLSSHQNSFSSTDPQIDMLADAGRSHLDVLLEADDSPDMYLSSAVLRVVTSEQKPQVIRAMTKHRYLVKVIESKGWEEDAKAELIAGLENEPSYLPTEWIEAAARLKDPATYPLLRRYLAVGLNPSSTFNAIQGLDGIDLTDAVDEAWARTKNGPLPFRDVGMAAIAAGYGHADALNWLVDALAGQEWDRGRARGAIRSLTDAKGDDDEIKKWFASNKSKLVWDADKKKFTAHEPAK